MRFLFCANLLLLTFDLIEKYILSKFGFVGMQNEPYNIIRFISGFDNHDYLHFWVLCKKLSSVKIVNCKSNF